MPKADTTATRSLNKATGKTYYLCDTVHARDEWQTIGNVQTSSPDYTKVAFEIGCNQKVQTVLQQACVTHQ